MNTRYTTPKSFEMAVKNAAEKSSKDTGKALQDFYTDRFIDRIFSVENPKFILKGGRSMLARLVNARSTTDTDFVYRGYDINDAVDELKKIASIDLNDYLRYEFADVQPIAQTEDYREGFRVKFTPVFGETQRKSNISIDLVKDPVVTDNFDILEPSNRLMVKGLEYFDYFGGFGSLCDKGLA